MCSEYCKLHVCKGVISRDKHYKWLIGAVKIIFAFPIRRRVTVKKTAQVRKYFKFCI